MNQFLSVLTTASASGEISIELESKDAATNMSLTCLCTGITTSNTEDEIAEIIYNRISAVLTDNDANYDGSAPLSREDKNAEWSIYLTDHIIALWSECRFTLKVTSNNTSSILRLGHNPALDTVSGFISNAEINGVELSITEESKIADIIMQASAEIVGRLRNYIVLTTYLKSIRGRDKKSIYLRPRPWSKDTMRVRRKYSRYGANITDIADFNDLVNLFPDGELNFQPDENIYPVDSPFDMDNEVVVTYLSGYDPIPDEVKKALALVYSKNSSGLSGQLLEFGGGSLKAKYGQMTLKDIDKMIYQPLRKYKA